MTPLTCSALRVWRAEDERRTLRRMQARPECAGEAREGAARRVSRGGDLRLCHRRQVPQNRVRRKRRAKRGREVGVQKIRRLGSGTSGIEGGSCGPCQTR